jgi:hypothetical protein
MFSALSDRASLAFFRLATHAADIAATTQHTQALTFTVPKVLGAILAPPATTGPVANCTDAVITTIVTGASTIVHIMMGLGVTVAVFGIILGGLMRATSFGNERRIAMSNTAITCAVVGLVIVIIGATAGNELPTWFGTTGCSIT